MDNFHFSISDKWIGFYYPDQYNLSKDVQSPELNSYEECVNWVNSQINLYNPSGDGYDYECGKNCRFDSNYSLYICKETIK